MGILVRRLSLDEVDSTFEHVCPGDLPLGRCTPVSTFVQDDNCVGPSNLVQVNKVKEVFVFLARWVYRTFSRTSWMVMTECPAYVRSLSH